MNRFPGLSAFLGEELLLVAAAMADGSYWRDDASDARDHSLPAVIDHDSQCWD